MQNIAELSISGRSSSIGSDKVGLPTVNDDG
jgi:hypothetical protein